MVPLLENISLSKLKASVGIVQDGFVSNSWGFFDQN